MYLQLKAAGFDVRGLVRNASKAKEYLDCGACTEAEGIYVGDVTMPETLTAAMTNVTRVAIAVIFRPVPDFFYASFSLR